MAAEARGALLSSEESYAPPVYDEAAGTFRPQETAEVVVRPQQAARPVRSGVSRGSGGDEYVALGSEEDGGTAQGGDAATMREARANEIALRRQQQHAEAFKRQIEAEEEFLRSARAQVERDAEVAAKLAQGTDETATMDSIQQSQRDAEMAARLQREYDQRSRRRAPSQPQSTRKTIRVMVPATARPGDSLSVKTSTMGKFEVIVPEWARPNTHFDCIVTTTVQLAPPGAAATTHNPVYQPPTESTLPSGWERATNADGTPFYIDHNTRTTHWAPPAPDQQQQQQQQQQQNRRRHPGAAGAGKGPRASGGDHSPSYFNRASHEARRSDFSGSLRPSGGSEGELSFQRSSVDLQRSVQRNSADEFFAFIDRNSFETKNSPGERSSFTDRNSFLSVTDRNSFTGRPSAEDYARALGARPAPYAGREPGSAGPLPSFNSNTSNGSVFAARGSMNIAGANGWPAAEPIAPSPAYPPPTFPANFQWDVLAGEGGDGAEDDIGRGSDIVPMQS